MYVATPIVAIEITRRCNLNCAHCMRGEAENCTITKELLEKLFDEVKSANELVISGGEPFLCYDQIKTLIEILKSKLVIIPKVTIVTNGTIYDERIYNLLEKHFKSISITISMDNYHIDSIEKHYTSKKKSTNPRLFPINIEEIIENIELHKKTGYFRGFFGSPRYLVDFGRARNLTDPKMPFKALGYFYTDCMPNMIVAGPRIYLDCLGYITEGDSEYESRNILSIGNLNDISLSKMLISNAIEIEATSGEEFAKFLFDREKDYATRQEKSFVYKNNKITEGLELPLSKI